jgi:hypothetical protein
MIKPEYLRRVPAEVPPGRVLAHNHVYPVCRRAGWRGSRYWLDGPSAAYEPCPCPWAPELGTHYRVAAARREQP